MKSRYTIEFPSLTRIKEFRGYHGPDFIWVEKYGHLLLRESVYLCAKYFKREEGYDFIQYSVDEPFSSVKPFLFFDYNYPHAIGGGCFRLKSYSNVPVDFWELDWVWLHPFSRNKGLFSSRINEFNEKFGYWYPSKPHSKAMTAIMKKLKLIAPLDFFEIKK